MSSGARILVVDSERHVRRALTASLESLGYAVDAAETGDEALERIARRVPDLLVTELSLSGVDGLELIRRLRAQSTLPIIVLSAVDEEKRKVDAFEAGADDYVMKPFGEVELGARIRSLLRRVAGSQGGEPTFVCEGLSVDFGTREVRRGDEVVKLTPTEYEILKYLIQHAGKVVTHQMLLSAVWGDGHAKDTQYLKVFVGHLRRKIESNPSRPRYLVTDPGVGYRFSAEPRRAEPSEAVFLPGLYQSPRTVELLLYRDAEHPGGAAKTHQESAMPNVLIVEDVATEREIIGRVVSNMGQNPVFAANGEEAVERARESKPSLILMDVVMPKMNGYTACRALKQDPDTKSIPIILVTSKNTSSDVFWGQKQGADGHISKPFTQEMLAAAIKKFTGAAPGTQLFVPADVVSQATLDALVKCLAVRVGPLARTLLNEHLEKLGLTPQTFGRSRFSEMVRSLAEEVADPAGKASFRKEAEALAS